MLAAAQLGVTVCSVALGVLAEPAVAHLLEGPLHAIGLSAAAVHAVAFTIALLLVVGLHVVLVEMVPKNISVTYPEKAALVLVPTLLMFEKVFYPIIAVLNWTSLFILRLMGIEPKDEVASAFTAEEVASIIEASEAAGVLHDDHGLISGALEFSEHDVRDVMVPVTEVLYFEAADKYVRVITADGEYLIRTPLRQLIQQLPPDLFWQVQRGVLVRADAIASVQREESGKMWLRLRGRPEDERLPVGRLYAHLFKAM